MALRRNILIFHQGALGDFVLTWPLALALARIHPQSRVFYVTHSGKGKLAERALGVEWADAEAGWHALFGAGGAALPDAPGRLLAGAHSVVSFLSAPDGPFVQNVKRLAPEANVLAINPAPPDDFPGHVTEFQLAQLRPWPAAHSAAEQILRSIASRGVGAKRSAETPYVAVHPGSGSMSKNWPPERFLELAKRLSDAGQKVRVLLGEVERDRWPKETVGQFERVGAVAWPGTHVELMNELLNARAFVGNDSGPGHVAAALAVPSVIVFGPTSPVRWKPLGPRVEVVRGEPLDQLAVETVYDAVQRLI